MLCMFLCYVWTLDALKMAFYCHLSMWTRYTAENSTRNNLPPSQHRHIICHSCNFRVNETIIGIKIASDLLHLDMTGLLLWSESYVFW
jgi:hypothetical protein